MGRKKKYNSPEELREAERRNSMKYYWKNAESIKRSARIRYKRKKKEVKNIEE